MINRAIIIALRGFAVMAALMVGATSVLAANEPQTPGDGKSPRPNILLIIGDDIGIDVTTDMYPGLIDSLVKQYGPSGHNHPDYRKIDGRTASTPTLNRLAHWNLHHKEWVRLALGGGVVAMGLLILATV